MLNLRPKHNKIWTQWALDILLDVEQGMMVQTFQNGILKSNHLLPVELFKKKKTNTN